MYADDVVFYTSKNTLRESSALLQEDATSAYDWFTRSGLCINTDKTKVVVFTHERPDIQPILNIKMGNDILSTCSQYEYLGIILDDVLTLERTISKTVTNTNFRHVMLKKAAW